jgi:hypothetical protein
MDNKWDWNKNLDDFREVSKNLKSEGQTSRADCIDYLIARCKRIEKINGNTAEDAYMQFFYNIINLDIKKLKVNMINPVENFKSNQNSSFKEIWHKYNTDPFLHNLFQQNLSLIKKTKWIK